MQADMLCANARPFDISDINTTINHEPRILDVRLAEALGFDHPRRIRSLIQRHMDALQRFGEVCTSVVQTSAKGGKPGKANWLTKKQALYICTKSETPNATEVTIQMVDVFDAVTAAKPIPMKEHRVRSHRRALPAPPTAAIPKPFDPGSDMLLDLQCAVMTANIWVEKGILPDFARAFERVLFDRHGMKTCPNWQPAGPMYDWNGQRCQLKELQA